MQMKSSRITQKEPDSTTAVSPGYDPMDLIVQDLQNVQKFIHLEEHPGDLGLFRTPSFPNSRNARTYVEC